MNNITCTSKMRLHSSSAAKKVQNQIYPWTISHVHQKCVFTLPLQQKKYKSKFTHEEYHMYIKKASSLFLCSKKSTKSNLPMKNITCTSKMRLHSSSAAKKVQNLIYPGWISHVHQKCIFTLPLQQKKYKIKFTQDEYHMYIKNASSLFLCSKKSTKSNLPRMNITCTSKMRLNTHSVRTSKMRAIF